MRGDGRVFLRGRIYWIEYSWRGKAYRESAETTDETTARKLLKQRLKDVEKPNFVGPKENRSTLDNMLEVIKASYARKKNRSFASVEDRFRHLKRHFEFHRVVDITAKRIGEYQLERLKEGAARASVNREVAYLRHGFRLMFQQQMISLVPPITLLGGENVREGFLNIPDFEAAAAEIENEDTRDIVRFLYYSAWRAGEARNLEWSKLDLHDWVIRLPRKSSKNKKPRTLVLVGDLREIIERRLEKRLPDCPFVFHRNGKQVKSFRKAFKSACKEVGLEGIIPHDMRRSGVRNLRRSGNDEHDCMEISGHETRAIFDRYDIVDEDDQRRALERQQEYKRQQMEQGRKVVRLKKTGVNDKRKKS